jgi:hypothetical protein
MNAAVTAITMASSWTSAFRAAMAPSRRTRAERPLRPRRGVSAIAPPGDRRRGLVPAKWGSRSRTASSSACPTLRVRSRIVRTRGGCTAETAARFPRGAMPFCLSSGPKSAIRPPAGPLRKVPSIPGLPRRQSLARAGDPGSARGTTRSPIPLPADWVGRDRSGRAAPCGAHERRAAPHRRACRRGGEGPHELPDSASLARSNGSRASHSAATAPHRHPQ